MDYFYLKGGIIEANAPNRTNKVVQICFRIDPDESVFFMGAITKVSTNDGINRIGLYDQEEIPNLNYKLLIKRIAIQLVSYKIFGVMSFDIVCF